MAELPLRQLIRTVVVTALVLAVAGFLTWWTVSHRGDQDAEVRQPGVGARLATPDIVWPDGAPHGGLEESPWAQTVRDWSLASAVAHNARNYSDATFAALSSTELRQMLAQGTLDDVDDGQFATAYRLGPRPFTITGIAVESDGRSASVEVCDSSMLWDSLDSEEAARRAVTIPNISRGHTVTFRVEAQPDGTHVVTDRTASDTRCRLDGLQVALFDPAPPYGTITQPWEVIGTDGLPMVEPPGATPTATP